MHTAFCSYHESTSVSGRSFTVQPKASASAERDLDGAVGIIALSHIQNARQAADFAQIEVIEAVFAARKRQNQRIHRRGFDKLGVSNFCPDERRHSRRPEKICRTLPLLMSEMISSACESTAPCAKAGRQHVPAVDAAHALVMLVAAERKRLLDKRRKKSLRPQASASMWRRPS